MDIEKELKDFSDFLFKDVSWNDRISNDFNVKVYSKNFSKYFPPRYDGHIYKENVGTIPAKTWGGDWDKKFLLYYPHRDNLKDTIELLAPCLFLELQENDIAYVPEVDIFVSTVVDVGYIAGYPRKLSTDISDTDEDCMRYFPNPTVLRNIGRMGLPLIPLLSVNTDLSVDWVVKIPFNRPPSFDVTSNELTELCKKSGIKVLDTDKQWDLRQKYDRFYRSQPLLNYYRDEG